MPHAADAKRLLAQANNLLAACDLAGSRRLALQALDADPLLDGVDQALAVSDVLLAAAKAADNRTDWYAILRIDPPYAAVDPATIKRKYRKLALLLHPDKNTSPGADAAFKLVLEAWAVLSDPARRAGFDGELAVAAAPSPDNFYAGCPHCNHIHEYPRVYEDRILRCCKCSCGFRAEEVRIQPQLVPGKDAYYFNWGFSYPPAMQMPAIGGFGAGYGSSPYLAMANPCFAPPHAYATPVPAPVPISVAKATGEDDDDGRGCSASEPVNVRSKPTAVGRKVAMKTKSAAKSRGHPQVKALTSSAPVRQSPRLRSGAAGNSAPVETRKAAAAGERKKNAVIETRNTESNKTAAAETGKAAGVETRNKAAASKTEKKTAGVATRNKAAALEKEKKTAGVGSKRNKATAAEREKKTTGVGTRNKPAAPETEKKTAGVGTRNKAATETAKKSVGTRNKFAGAETSKKAAAMAETRKSAAAVNTETDETLVAVETAVVKGKKAAAVSTKNASIEKKKKPAVARKNVAVTAKKATTVSGKKPVLGLAAWVESVARRAKSLRSSGEVVEPAMALPEKLPRKRKAAASPLSNASPEKRPEKSSDRVFVEVEVNANEAIGVANVECIVENEVKMNANNGVDLINVEGILQDEVKVNANNGVDLINVEGIVEDEVMVNANNGIGIDLMEGIVEDEIVVNANEGVDLMNVEGIVEVEVVKMDGNESVEVVKMDDYDSADALKIDGNEGTDGMKVDGIEKVDGVKVDGIEKVDEMKVDGNEGVDKVKECGNEGADAVGLEIPNDKIGEENGVMFDLFGNCGDDPGDMNNNLMDTDISDILNSLPKIYDASGQEVRF